ncbi:MAG: hypothetical protein ACMUIU_09070 [bacterium]
MKKIFLKSDTILIISKTILLISILSMYVLSGNSAVALTINLPDGYFADKYITNIDPVSLAFSPDGSLYVKHWYKCDSHITRFNSNGTYETIAVIPLAEGRDQGPIVLDAEGNIYIALYPSRVYEIDLKSSEVKTFEFINSHGAIGIDIGPDGNLYVMTNSDGLVWQVNPDTGERKIYTDTKILGRGTSIFRSLQFDPSGNLLSSSSSYPYWEIISIDPSGEISSYLGDPGFRLFNPVDMMFNSGGKLFVSSLGKTRRANQTNYTDAAIWLIGQDRFPELFVTFLDDSVSRARFISLAIDNSDNLYFGSGVRDADFSISRISNQSASLNPITYQGPTKDFIFLRGNQEDSGGWLLFSFDSYVDEGILAGSGPGNSAPMRLKAFRNMIESSINLLCEGHLDEGIEQLMDAYKHIDGLPNPPDFVTGFGSEEMAFEFQMMIENLNGCK